MKNEELRAAQEELEASRSRYAELYDLAPISYFTFDSRGLIKEVNLTGVQMLGVPRSHLSNAPFAPFLVDDEDLRTFRAFYKQAFTSEVRQSCERRIRKRDKTVFPAQLQGMAVENIDNKAKCLRVAMIDITIHRAAEAELERLILEKMEALSRIKTLSDLLPICLHCKKIRDDQDYWSQLESYIRDHSEAEFTHGICPECAKEWYTWIDRRKEEQNEPNLRFSMKYFILIGR